MNQKIPPADAPAKVVSAAAGRKARLAAELRENLKKRKNQQRKRQETPPEEGSGPAPEGNR